jgi:light-regulated signal transduction histidine kinase (bacteriophytochrome)
LNDVSIPSGVHRRTPLSARNLIEANLDPLDVEKLFGVFRRRHAKESFSATGIGLVIVKRIPVRHGGRVRAEGKVNEDVTFYFMLPATEGRHG